MLIYNIENLKVTHSLGEYRFITNKFRIYLLVITKIEEIKDDTLIIPRNSFQFVDLEMLEDRLNQNTYLTDTYLRLFDANCSFMLQSGLQLFFLSLFYRHY